MFALSAGRQDHGSRVKHPIKAEDHVEALIDEALEETFPASDPPAPAVDTAVKVKDVPDERCINTASSGA